MAGVRDLGDPLAALEWLVSIGADEAIADQPIDRLHAPGLVRDPVPTPEPGLSPGYSPATPQRAAASRTEATPFAPPVPLGIPATTAARDLAANAGSLSELEAAIRAFEGLTLKTTATNLVFADGNPQAPLMLIGEAPGAEEDRRGLPFVGASGHLLDRMLAAIGRDRSNTYITNIVNWRPPGNRKPSPAEMGLSLPFIERHIALVNPAAIVLLGDTAAKTLTGRTEGITRMRGRWISLSFAGFAKPIEAMPTFHPAFLLRSPAQKREAWIDLLAIQAKLAELGF